MRGMALLRLRGYRMTAAACGLVVTTAALASGSGVLADATPAAPQAVRAQLAYSCRLPAAARPVGVTVAGTFPAAAVAGQPIKLSGLRTTVTVPPAMVASLRRLGVTALTGRDVLSATVANNAKEVTARWPGTLDKPVPISSSNGLHLTFPAAAPPVIAGAPGQVTFSAAGFTFALIAHKANAVAPGSAPLQFAATCALASGKPAKLAAVPVARAPTGPDHSGSGRLAKSSRTPSGGTPKGCARLLVHGAPNPVLGCAFLLGYADVLKLQEAALVGPGPGGIPPGAFLHVDTYESDVGCVPTQPTLAACIKHHGVVHAYSCSIAQLDYHKQRAFPPAKATFLNFQFVPVTAVMQLSETAWPRGHQPTENRKCYQGFNKLTPVPIKSPVVSVFTDLSDDINGGLPVLNISETYLTIHISQVAVNGVPLNVGPDCGTAQSVHAVLTGRGHNGPPPTGYTLSTGGPLTGSVTIPKFAHCGVGENLDPLFDASISGPMNFQLMTQGTLCTPQQNGKPGCPPTVPKPRRHV